MSENKISIEGYNKVVSEMFKPVIEKEWRGMLVQIKTCLSFLEMLEFVDSVVESCFAEDTGMYLPEIKDFATRCAILTKYSNFSLPDGIEQKYNFVYASDIVNFVVGYIDEDQFRQMLMAIDKKIEYRAQAQTEKLNQQMNDVVTQIGVLGDNLASVFGGIDGDTISKIAGAISNGSFDEKKLVQAFSENKFCTEAS